jgi:hypothetical protein
LRLALRKSWPVNGLRRASFMATAGRSDLIGRPRAILAISWCLQF